MPRDRSLPAFGAFWQSVFLFLGDVLILSVLMVLLYIDWLGASICVRQRCGVQALPDVLVVGYVDGAEALGGESADAAVSGEFEENDEDPAMLFGECFHTVGEASDESCGAVLRGDVDAFGFAFPFDGYEVLGGDRFDEVAV